MDSQKLNADHSCSNCLAGIQEVLNCDSTKCASCDLEYCYHCKKSIVSDDNHLCSSVMYEKDDLPVVNDHDIAQLYKQILSLSNKVVEADNDNKKITEFNDVLLQNNSALRDENRELKNKYDELNKLFFSKVNMELEQCRKDIKELSHKYDLLRQDTDFGRDYVIIYAKDCERMD